MKNFNCLLLLDKSLNKEWSSLVSLQPKNPSLPLTIADSDGDGSIDIGKFLQLMFPSAGQLISNLKQNFASKIDVRANFASWDSNKDGQISFAELKSALQR